MGENRQSQPPLDPWQFCTPQEIDAAIAKFQCRIDQLNKLDIQAGVFRHVGDGEVVATDVQESIREIFGSNSPEFRDQQHISIWHSNGMAGKAGHELARELGYGRDHMITILNGLINRLNENRADLTAGTTPAPSTYFDRLNLHPRVRDAARDLCIDGHPWDAVFAASKALVNYVKERSNRHDLDGASLMWAVFSRSGPILLFNDLADTTQQDEQEGMRHLFEGAVLAIRNPGSHAFPEGSDRRAIEYTSFLSALAYRVQEANIRKNPPRNPLKRRLHELIASKLIVRRA